MKNFELNYQCFSLQKCHHKTLKPENHFLLLLLPAYMKLQIKSSQVYWKGRMRREAGGMFKWEGTWVNLWLIHVDVRQKPMQYLKQLSFNKKINKLKRKKAEGIQKVSDFSHRGTLHPRSYLQAFSVLITCFIIVFLRAANYFK